MRWTVEARRAAGNVRGVCRAVFEEFKDCLTATTCARVTTRPSARRLAATFLGDAFGCARTRRIIRRRRPAETRTGRAAPLPRAFADRRPGPACRLGEGV